MHDPPNLNRSHAKLGIATALVATSPSASPTKTAGLRNFEKDLLL